jgi:flagellar hook protein FlgE
MLRAMYSGITGLRNFQNQMDVVGNNIANVNTTGFKASRITFQTTLLQTINAGRMPDDNYGGINPTQIGLGSKVASIDKIMSQGSFQNTGKKTDLALQGDGFFVLSDGSGQFYTRAGNFSLDTSGRMVDPSTGMTLQGWNASLTTSGARAVNTNNPIGDIRISAGLIMPAQQTSFINLANNLNANVGIQETTLVVKNTMGQNLPLTFSFEKDMSIDFRDSNRYYWNAESPSSHGFYNYRENGDDTVDYINEFKGFVELDELGNVVNWVTFDDQGSAKSDTKMLVLDPMGELKQPNAVDGDTPAVEYDDSGTLKTAGFSGSINLKRADGTQIAYNPSDIEMEFAGGNLTITLKDLEGNDITFEITDGSVSTISAFNNAFANGITDATGNYEITGLSMIGTGAGTISDETYNFVSVREAIQPPAGGILRFTDIQNPQNFVVADYSSPVVSTSAIVYDSLGKGYNVYVNFEKIDTNTWRWNAEFADGTPLYKVSQEGQRLQDKAEGVISFDGNGTIAASNWSLNDAGEVVYNGGGSGFWFDPSKSGSALNPEHQPSSSAGAGPVMVNLQFQEITQFAGQHSVTVNNQNGNAVGTLEAFAVNDVGQIFGTFTNGRTDILGQIALANFNNPAGLLEVGNSMYVISANSGMAQIGEANVGGRGTMIPGALEMSNVDLAEEFTHMIVSQRGFQAASRIITTADQILNELVQMKR